MADEKKISGLTEATDASASDEFVVVNKDVVDGQDASATGQTSKITLDNLRNAILGGSSGSTGNDVIFDGKVGIGTSDPASMLDIQTDTTDALPIRMKSMHPNQTGIRLTNGAGDTASAWTMSSKSYGDLISPSSLIFQHGTDTPSKENQTLVLSPTGNVGIGPASPSHGKLVVSGQYEGSTSDGVGLEFNTTAETSSIESYIRAEQGTGDNEGVVGAMPLSIHASTLDMKASFFNMTNAGQYGATGLHIWNSGDGFPGDQGLIGAYTSYGVKTNEASEGPDYSYYTGIDMTEEGSPPNFKIGYRLHEWAKPDQSNDLVVITSDGRVGIGTGFSPDPTQTVAGMLHLNNSHTDGNAELIFNYASNMFDNTTPQQVGISYTDALHIGSVYNDAPLIAMTLKSNGDVVVAKGVSASGFDETDLDNVRATDASGLDNINNLVVSDFEKDGVTKTGIVAQDMQKVLPQSVSGGDEYEHISEAHGRVVSGLGTDDEHEHCYDIPKSAFDSDETNWGDGAEFIEINAEQAETRTDPLATSNDELIAMLVKSVQELSAKVDELSK